ncbi:hypothetical protein BASA60_001815 [Batrachochytrium salamandrivorans]|nr:hypothetical protein BASA60_001815 [Batrachochytrium salamandrivorans]
MRTTTGSSFSSSNDKQQQQPTFIAKPKQRRTERLQQTATTQLHKTTNNYNAVCSDIPLSSIFWPSHQQTNRPATYQADDPIINEYVELFRKREMSYKGRPHSKTQ